MLMSKLKLFKNSNIGAQPKINDLPSSPDLGRVNYFSKLGRGLKWLNSKGNPVNTETGQQGKETKAGKKHK